jgi:acetyl-CoA acetyltransferase
MSEVFVVGAGMTRFGKHPQATVRDLAEEAIASALASADISVGDVDAVVCANAVEGLMTGQENIRGQVMLRTTGLLGRPIINVENACASAATAFHVGRSLIGSGEYEIVLVVGAEKLNYPDKQRAMRAFDASTDLGDLPAIRGQLGLDASEERTRSVFMDMYAAGLIDGGEAVSVNDLALVSVKNHEHGALNPFAQFQQRITSAEVLASRRVAGQLRLLMCCALTDGAAALVLTNDRRARRPGTKVRVRASALRSGRGDDRTKPTALEAAASRAYEEAGIGPEDLDVVEVHDATARAELSAYEGLRLAQPGCAGELLSSHATWLGGRLPVNTSGGLLSRGHPIGATGLAQLTELYWQLTDQAGARQVLDARLGLAQNAGGFVGTDAAAMAVSILERVSA